jgi:hypothetical protein
VRSVVPIRLSDEEHEQIARAARARDLRFSSFVRWAALEAATDQLMRAVRPKEPSREPPREQIVVVDPEPATGHAFVEGQCKRCGLDVDDIRGRDTPCGSRTGNNDHRLR